MILLDIFSAQKDSDGKAMSKVIVLDEAHKYLDEDFAATIAETIREMRHRATTILIASQDPLSVPRQVIELSSVIILHRMTSPDWLRHLQRASTALKTLQPSNLNGLSTKGEAYIWAKDSSESSVQNMPQKMSLRPRATKHGGVTLSAIR
jgi:DNA helicase HerA-like ATPase